MDNKPTLINVAIGILCLVQLTFGCGKKDEQPQKAVTVSKKIVAKTDATAPVAASSQPAAQATASIAAPAPGKAPVQAPAAAETGKPAAVAVPGGKVKPDAAGQAAVTKADALQAGVKPGAPPPTEQIMAAVAQAEIQKMQPEGIIGYNPEGKTDPFVPLFKEGLVSGADEQNKERRIPRTPLEMVDLGQLKLVAIMRSQSGNKALVEETSGKGYIVAKGSYMGINSGRVVKILKDSIIIEEEAENIMGKRIIQERELKLKKPLGEE